MAIILKLVSLIYIMAFALKPFEMMELTSEYLKLIPIKKRADCSTKHVFMTLILTIRFIVLYSFFFYQIINGFLQKYRLITQDQVTTAQKVQKLTVSINQEPTNEPLSNITTSSSASSITEPKGIDSSADEKQDLSNKVDHQFKHAGNAVDIPIETIFETLEEPTKVQVTVNEKRENIKTDTKDGNECEKRIDQTEITKTEEEEPKELAEDVKVEEKPREIAELKEAEEEKIKQVEEIKAKKNEEEEENPIEELKVKLADEDKPKEIEKAEVVDEKTPVIVRENQKRQEVVPEEETIKDEKNENMHIAPDNIIQPAQSVSQEEINQVVEEFPMAPNNEPQQSAPPSNSLKVSSLNSSSRRMSEGSATPALTSSSSDHGSPASRRSSYSSSVVDNTPQSSKLLSKIKGQQQQQQINSSTPLADNRPPSRFLSLRIGGKHKSQQPEEQQQPQPKVSLSSKLKSGFKFMKKGKSSSKRASQILQ